MDLRRKNSLYYFKCLIGFAVMTVFQVMPPVGNISPIGMRVLGIYLGTVVLWALVDLIWPSLLGMLLVCLTGYTTFGQFISSGFGNTTVIFVFLMSIFAYFITSSGVSEYIAKFIVMRKFARNKPWVISALYVFASYMIALMISSVAAVIVVLDFFSEFARENGYTKGDKYPVIMMVCITFAAHMGGSVWTFRTPDAILVGYIQQQGGSVPMLPYFLCSVFIGGGALIIYMLCCKFLLNPNVEGLKTCGKAEMNDIRLSPYQRRMLICSLVLLLLLIVESATGSDSSIGALMDRLGTNGIVVSVLVVMMFLRRRETGGPLADIEAGTKAVPWKIFYLIIFNMPMAAAINDEALGISSTITVMMDSVFGGNNNSLWFIFVMTVMIVLCTTFVGNVPVCLLFYNITAVYAPTLGISLPVLACIISLTSNASVILPSSNPQAAMLHGRKDWVETKDVAKYALLQSGAVLVTVSIAYALFLQKVL